jgi:hypothetical protein
MEAYAKAVQDEEPGMRTLASSGCISECAHKETIVYYSFAEPIDRALVESLAGVGELYVDEATGIFKVVKLDHFYIFGVLGERELRICMYYVDKLSDRLKIDRRLIEHFQARGDVRLSFNRSGSLARIAIPASVPEGVLAAVH